jgi:dipeptidyl aminopeptidase/acylaminoacyl peptidase
MSVGSLDVKPEQQDSRKLTEADLGGAYSPSSEPGLGQLLFLRGKTLLAQPFDARHLKVTGKPVRVLDEPLGQWYDSGTFSVSANGTLAYWSHRTSESQLTWFDKQGNILSKVGKTGLYDYDSVALSPDGTRALVSARSSPSQNQALWLVDLSRGTSRPLELDPSVDNGNAVWSPDGHSIIYGSTQAGQTTQIYRKELSGPASPEILPTPGEWKFPRSWSPDGRFLLYQSMGGSTRGDLWVLPLKGRQKPVPFARTGFDEGEGVFSPDGRWVAYASNESGRCEVYVRPFSQNSLGEGSSNAGTKWLVSDNGGTYPMWRHDGKELYYIDLDGKVMAVKLTAERAFQTGVPKPLFQGPERGSVDDPYSWAPSPDGKRFLFLVPEMKDSAAFTIVLNWQAALK